MLNSIILMGRLVADPELKTTRSGVSTCTVRLAVERNFTRQGEEKQADFFDVVTWRSTAEFVARYMSKGQLVAVQGSMQSRKWQDKEGSSRISWEVQAENVYFAESRRSEPASEPREVMSRSDAIGVPLNDCSEPEDFMRVLPDGDLPFLGSCHVRHMRSDAGQHSTLPGAETTDMHGALLPVRLSYNRQHQLCVVQI